MKYSLLFLDTETTGNEEKDRLCQLCYSYGDTLVDELFNPPLPISVESQAVHHITPKMVKDKPAFKVSPTYIELDTILKNENTIFVAHNAKFDIGMLEKEGLSVPRFICTLRVARALDKQNIIPRYNLQYLRYYLEMEIDATAHDAMGDVLVLKEFFKDS
jgi:exodeoxyribonuclease X